MDRHKNPQTTIRIHKDLKLAVTDLAKKQNKSFNELMIEVLEKFLGECENE